MTLQMTSNRDADTKRAQAVLVVTAVLPGFIRERAVSADPGPASTAAEWGAL